MRRKALSAVRVERIAVRARALGDPTRVRILQLLFGGECRVGEIASRVDVAPPAVSKHLKVLFNAGLVGRRREATEVFYAAILDRLDRCLEALAQPGARESR